MDSELLLKFIEYFPDYLSALLHTLLRCFGQPLSKQLYVVHVVSNLQNNHQYSWNKKIIVLLVNNPMLSVDIDN